MPSVVLRAGPLQMAFSPEDGSLRYVRFDDVEVLRGVSAPIRDGVWATVRPAISDLVIDQRDDSFRVRFTALCENGAVSFRWRGEIEGTAEGDLRFDFDGEALSGFLRNRIGFCVLHGSELSGLALTIEHVDGKTETGFFPKWIRPDSPHSNIRGLSYAPAETVRAELRLEGDTFEMEDQRNWSDASFKTYCTPLSRPYPVAIKKGERIRQSAHLRVRRSAGSTTTPRTVAPWTVADEVSVEIGSPLQQSLPSLGTAFTEATHSARAVENLRQLGLAHLRVDVEVRDPGCMQKLQAADVLANQLGISLEVALFLDDAAAGSIARFRADLERSGPRKRVARWIIFNVANDATPPALVALAENLLAAYSPTAQFGGGVTDNFAELNRAPAIAKVGDFVSLACNPQVHAFDEPSMIETLAMQRLIVRNALRLSDGGPVIMSPLTMTRRWRLKEPGAPRSAPAGLMPFQTDPRHATPFARAWTFGSVAALSYSGITSVTFFETLGAGGLVSGDGDIFPLTSVFRELAPFQGARLIATESEDEWRVAAIALDNGTGQVAFLANLQNAPQNVRVRGGWKDRILTLAPYEIARLLPSDDAIRTSVT